jgi:hypothetical protein
MESPAAHAREQQLKKLEEQTREANEKPNVSTAFFDILKKNYEVRALQNPSDRSLRKSSPND